MTPLPISWLQYGAFCVAGLVFFAAVLRAFARRARDSSARRDRRSQVGIVVQSLAFGLAAFGGVRPTLALLSASSLAATAAVLLLTGGAIALFVASSRELGPNWSLTARTRDDHELVQTGPYSWVRHPIYLGMLLFLLALAVALGHWTQLLLALPVFFAGTAIRTRIEDNLLEKNFGDAFVKYRSATPALIPRLF